MQGVRIHSVRGNNSYRREKVYVEEQNPGWEPGGSLRCSGRKRELIERYSGTVMWKERAAPTAPGAAVGWTDGETASRRNEGGRSNGGLDDSSSEEDIK